MKEITVSLALEVTVDAEAWGLTYGYYADKDIAEDVVRWVTARVWDESGEDKVVAVSHKVTGGVA